jgi:putative tributyrin esterase
VTALFDINFFSKTLNMNTSMKVIMPQGKKSIGVSTISEFNKYKIMYLLHGMTDDHTVWSRRSNIERYVSDKNMIVVMPNVHLSWYTDTQYGLNYWQFISEELPQICHDFFPYISPQKTDHLVVGLSMGGYGAIKMALKRSDYFGYGASLSGALNIVDSLKNNNKKSVTGQKASTQERLFWQGIFGDFTQVDAENIFTLLATDIGKTGSKYFACCGYQDFLLEHTISFEKECKKRNYQLTTDYSDGSHEWGYWDKQIRKVINWFEENEKNSDNSAYETK